MEPGYQRTPRTRAGKTPLHREGRGTGKVCRGCGVLQTYACFPWNYNKALGRSYRASRCHGCKAKRTREWSQATYGDRSSHGIGLKKCYGLTLAQYDAMLAEQGSVCAICNQPEFTPKANGKGIRPLGVDHDHATGAIRGLLCATCNNGLGCFKDDPKKLQAALSYLAKYS